ncbi:IclR family transcriptional regulator [Geomicrobium sp. JCM 19039]|uniref:IclR family transcriptional regulator n=1 Tax=Geomicrobium sp. JCM 19039 TaxID=1460636 RepID=UPI00045F3870|nr:IclR family transcriptional regulator [Geomicrobium sp. JCM 19039]GAK12191.1 transcriptional regulator, IclR family [Geomicrobium sp. JCM 19039]
MKELNVKANRSIERAFQVLNCFSLEESELSIGDFVAKTDLSRATLYRIIKTMQDVNYIQYDPASDKYRLSIKFYQLGIIASSDIAIQKQVAPYMDELFKETKNTILLAALRDKQLIYLDKRESEEGLKISSKVGKIREPDYGLLGKTIIGALPDDEQQTLIDHLSLVRNKEEIDHLNVKIQQVKNQDYLYMINETTQGVSGIAVPIRAQFTMSIGVLFPSFQIDEKRKKEIINRMLEFAKEITKILNN